MAKLSVVSEAELPVTLPAPGSCTGWHGSTHTDSTTTVAATSSSSARLQPSDDKASWGREVAHSAQGAWSVFVRQGDNGQRLVTHVTWADEERVGRAHAGLSDHEH